MNAARVMIQGLEKGVYFQYMEGDILKAVSTRGIEVDYGNLRPFKTGITWLLEHGFACVRDSLTYAEMKALSSAYGLEVVKDPLAQGNRIKTPVNTLMKNHKIVMENNTLTN